MKHIPRQILNNSYVWLDAAASRSPSASPLNCSARASLFGGKGGTTFPFAGTGRTASPLARTWKCISVRRYWNAISNVLHNIFWKKNFLIFYLFIFLLKMAWGFIVYTNQDFESLAILTKVLFPPFNQYMFCRKKKSSGYLGVLPFLAIFYFCFCWVFI